ncbi:hypothetical protein [Gordonia iterans]
MVEDPGTCKDRALRTIAARYLSGPALDGYLQFAEAQLGESSTVVMTPEHWLGADLTKEG